MIPSAMDFGCEAVFAEADRRMRGRTLALIFDGVANDSSIRAVILTDQGKSFCAGLDLKIVPSFSDADQKRLLNALNRAFYSVYRCPVPVIGAVNGHAIAGGLIPALACDWRIGADWPFLAGLTEVMVGIPYPVAAIEIARKELSPRMARELILFGENITAKSALECGVLDALVPAEQLTEHAMAKAQQASNLPQIGFAKVKRQLCADAGAILKRNAADYPCYRITFSLIACSKLPVLLLHCTNLLGSERPLLWPLPCQPSPKQVAAKRAHSL